MRPVPSRQSSEQVVLSDVVVGLSSEFSQVSFATHNHGLATFADTSTGLQRHVYAPITPGTAIERSWEVPDRLQGDEPVEVRNRGDGASSKTTQSS
jgi:hypothetical protein